MASDFVLWYLISGGARHFASAEPGRLDGEVGSWQNPYSPETASPELWCEKAYAHVVCEGRVHESGESSSKPKQNLYNPRLGEILSLDCGEPSADEILRRAGECEQLNRGWALFEVVYDYDAIANYIALLVEEGHLGFESAVAINELRDALPKGCESKMRICAPSLECTPALVATEVAWRYIQQLDCFCGIGTPTCGTVAPAGYPPASHLSHLRFQLPQDEPWSPRAVPIPLSEAWGLAHRHRLQATLTEMRRQLGRVLEVGPREGQLVEAQGD